MKDLNIETVSDAPSNVEEKKPKEPTPIVAGPEKLERMAAFFATEEGSAVLYEAVKNFMSTPEGVAIVENAIVAAIARRDWRDSNRNVRRQSK